jgi:tetratricopeptide (TPR) repeat protein
MSTSFKKAEILALIKTGQYNLALQQALAWLRYSANNCDALYISGLAYLFTGQFEKSIYYLQLAVKQKPDNAVYIANLGIAFLRSGDIDSAINNLKQAIKKLPDYEQAHYNLGSAYIKNQQAELAIVHYKLLSKQHPENAEYLCALADAIRETGQWLASIKLYKKVLQLDTDHYRAHTNMGPLMMHLGQLDDAVIHNKRAIELSPEQSIARKNLGDCYLQMEQLDEAMEAYADAYEINNQNNIENAELCVAIGNVWLETAEHAEASSWYLKANQIDKENIAALCGLANIEREINNLPQALALLQSLHEKEPENIDVLLSLSDTLWDDGDAQAALQHLNTVQKMQPQRTAVHAKIGNILASAGDIKAALKQYRTALEQNPLCIPALSGLATTQRGKLENNVVKSMQALLDNKTTSAKTKPGKSTSRNLKPATLKPAALKPGAQASLHNGLAFYYDGCKQYEKAAFHMQQANHFQWLHKRIRGWSYEPGKHEDSISSLIETFNPEYFKSFAVTENDNIDNSSADNNSNVPVFIVAMPRSGTTLSEQILARHKNVLGIGERNFAAQSFNQQTGNQPENFDFLKNLSTGKIKAIRQNYLKKLQQLADQSGKPDVSRIVDKMPDNYSQLGWILTLFPKAKIIHLQRDPQAVALSCWMTQFGSIRWACHKDHIVHRIQQYQRIMQHWREVIPHRFIEVRYEQLVENQREESARLIEYIGLDWDENCLQFYQSDRLIRTASITQVRQPIYQNSVSRWKSYQPYLADLFDPFSTD